MFQDFRAKKSLKGIFVYGINLKGNSRGFKCPVTCLIDIIHFNYL